MYTLSCFADEISPHLDEQLDVMERLKVRYLSLRSVEDVNVLSLTDAQVKDIRQALRSRGMGVSSIGSPVGKTPVKDDASICLDQTRRAPIEFSSWNDTFAEKKKEESAETAEPEEEEPAEDENTIARDDAFDSDSPGNIFKE